MAQDLRHALRLFARNPGFFSITVLTIALAIGGCTAVFSVVNAVLLAPMPYQEPDRLVAVSELHPGSPSTLGGLVLSNWGYQPAANVGSVESIAGFTTTRATVSGQGIADAERVPSLSITPSYFRVLRMAPIAGRLLEEPDAVDGAAPVVVIGDAFWRNRFGGDPGVLGRVLQVNGVSRQIVGIVNGSVAYPAEADIFTPRGVPPATGNGISMFGGIARLRAGATPEQFAAEATAAARALPRPYVAEVVFGKGGPVEVRVQRLVERVTSSVRPALLVLTVAVALVLVIACANVTNLFLSRGVGRTREMAVRAALGARRLRLLRQLMLESLLLASAGGAAGLLLGWGLVRLVPVLAPESFPRVKTIGMNGEVVAISIALSLVAGLIAGLLPALRGSRLALSPSMREGDVRTVTGSARGVRTLLLAGEAALAVVLLVGSMLLGRSFMNLMQVDAGYDPSNVLMASLVPVGTVPPGRLGDVTNQVLERVRAVPGVEAAGAGNMAPFGGSTAISGFTLPGTAGPDGKPLQARALSYTVSPGYIEALGMRIVEGRSIVPSDVTASTRAMLVNEAFAKTYFNDGKPATGRRFSGLFGNDNTTPFEVVGVSANVLPASLEGKPEPAVYLAQGTGIGYGIVTFVIRTSGDPAELGPTLRSTVKSVEPAAVTVDNVRALSREVSKAVAQPRFAATVLIVFAVLAVVLASVGLYGVLSYNVTARTREIGVRAALGAERGDLLRLVLKQGLGVTLLGLVIGMGAAALLTRLMGQMLFGVKPLDAASFAIAPLLLTIVATIACLVPAARAARIDPAVVLRNE